MLQKVSKKVYRVILVSLLICMSGYAIWAQTLTEEAKEILKKAKVIRVIVEESYEKADKVSLPFFDYAMRILRYGGFDVVKEDAKTYDATLHIKVKGTPLGANYRSGIRHTYGLDVWYDYDSAPAVYYYSGAEVKGELSIIIIGDRRFGLPFSCKISPSQIISTQGLIPTRIPTRYLTPNDAPFNEAFDEGFLPAVIKILAEIKGSEPLISILKDKDFWRGRQEASKALGELKDPRAVEPLIAALKDEMDPVQSSAAKALGKIKDVRAVEPLITALKDENSDVQWEISESLTKITGQVFGRDQIKWQNWWKENKKYNQAMDEYKKIMNIEMDESQKMDACYQIANRFYQQGQWSQALIVYKDFIEKYHREETLCIEVRYKIAQIYYEQNATKRAIEEYNLLINEYPASAKVPDAIYWLGKCFMKDDDHSTAVVTFRVLVTRFPDSSLCPNAQFHIGVCLYNNEEYLEAYNEFQKLVTTHSDHKDLVQDAKEYMNKCKQKGEIR